MSRVLIVTLMAVLLLIAVPAMSQGSTPNSVGSTGLTVSVQEYATLSQTTAAIQQFWQNGSATYDTGSTVMSVPYDAGGLNVTWTSLTELNLTYSFVGHPGYYPVVRAFQSAGCPNDAYCWNLTGPVVSISPSVSPLPVKITIPAAFTAAGVAPSSPAKYAVAVNATTTLPFAILSSVGWAAVNGTQQQLAYPIVVPKGYALNSTRIFVPYASGVTLNSTGLNVTVGGRSVIGSTQVVAGGVYIDLAGLTANATLIVRGSVQSVTSNGWVTVGLGPATATGVAGQYSASAFWSNGALTPYTGGIIITTNLTYAINPASVNVSMNGRYVPSSRFFLAGSTIELLPGSVIVPADGVGGFLVRFSFLGAAPTLTTTLSMPVVGSTTVGETLLVVIAVLSAVVLYGALAGPLQASRKPGGRPWNPTTSPPYLFVALFVLLFMIVVFVYLGIVGGWTV